MAFVYHLVPKALTGTTLYPLNRLETLHPHLFKQHSEKYRWRKETLQGRIPILDCLWNDVLHFSPVHPKLVKEALQEAGFEVGTWRVFEVDAARLEPEKTVLYRYLHQKREDKYVLPGNFAPFEPGMLSSISSVPKRTEGYYQEMSRQGKRPLIFVGVPHILYQGSLGISEIEVLTV